MTDYTVKIYTVKM